MYLIPRVWHLQSGEEHTSNEYYVIVYLFTCDYSLLKCNITDEGVIKICELIKAGRLTSLQ